MQFHPKKTLPLLVAATLLNGCGGGGDDGGGAMHLGVVADPNPDMPFFSEQTKFDFADSMSDQFSGLVDVASSLASENTSLASVNSTNENSDRMRSVLAVATESQACDSGNLTARVSTNDNTAAITGATLAFNSCKFENEIINGSISVSGSALASDEFEGNANFIFTNLRVDGAEAFAINGDISFAASSTAGSESVGINGSALTMSADGETISFQNFSLNAVENTAGGVSSVSMGMQLNSTMHGSLNIQINPALTASESAEYPATGKITMTHSDGSSLVIDADNGDASTFSYLVNDGSSTVSGNASWTELVPVELFDTI